MWPTVARYVCGVLLLTFVANIGVRPLIVHYFGRISTYALLANIPISLFATVILAGAFALLAAVALGVGWLATLLGWCLTAVVWLQNGWLAWVASLPYASVEGVQLNTIQTVLVYVIIGCVAVIIKKLFTNLFGQERTGKDSKSIFFGQERTGKDRKLSFIKFPP